MAGFGDFYNKNSKKKSKKEMAKQANKSSGGSYVFTPPEVVRKKKESW